MPRLNIPNCRFVLTKVSFSKIRRSENERKKTHGEQKQDYAHVQAARALTLCTRTAHIHRHVETGKWELITRPSTEQTAKPHDLYDIFVNIQTISLALSLFLSPIHYSISLLLLLIRFIGELETVLAHTTANVIPYMFYMFVLLEIT